MKGEAWIELTVAVIVGLFWARRVIVRIPRRVRMRVSFESFILNFSTQNCSTFGAAFRVRKRFLFLRLGFCFLENTCFSFD